MRPEDPIMDIVDNEESLYNAKMELFDRWLEEGDAWSEAKAHRQAHYFARQFAQAIKEMGYRGTYRLADLKEASDEMLAQFEDYREEAIKAVVERPRELVPPKPLTPGEIAHAQKYEALAQKIGVEALQALIPASPERIRRAIETGDKHLNTIPLRKWDVAGESIRIPGLSLGDKVSLLKHVAAWHYV